MVDTVNNITPISFDIASNLIDEILHSNTGVHVTGNKKGMFFSFEIKKENIVLTLLSDRGMIDISLRINENLTDPAIINGCIPEMEVFSEQNLKTLLNSFLQYSEA